MLLAVSMSKKGFLGGICQKRGFSVGPTEKQAQEASSCEYVKKGVSRWDPPRSIAADILIGLARPTEKQAQEGIWGGEGWPRARVYRLDAGSRIQDARD